MDEETTITATADDARPDALAAERVVIAVAQIDCSIGDVGINLARCLEQIDQAAALGAKLVVLPECSLSGYVFDRSDQVADVALALEAPELGALAARCAERAIHCVVGLIERERSGRLHNTAVLFGDDGKRLGVYRKTHLPMLGADRFVEPGQDAQPAVFETTFARIGVNICYDIRFPESARVLALAGADIIAHPSNWPTAARMLAEQFAPVRACENRVVVAVANRGDAENGTEFIGQSQIVAADGEVLARAGRGRALLTAEVDLAQARAKRIVRVPGAYETDLFADRRPELYGALVDPLPTQTHWKEP